MQVAKGAWGALEAVASDGGAGAGKAPPPAGGGGRHRKAAEAARSLLTLDCLDAKPVDLVTCYQRCCCGLAPGGAGAEATVGAAEVRSAIWGGGREKETNSLVFLKAKRPVVGEGDGCFDISVCPESLS